MSGWSVGQHVEHLLLADRGILSWVEEAIGSADPGPRASGPTLPGRIVLLTGYIPRGRGRAPEQTVPRGSTTDELAQGLAGVRGRVEGLEGRLDEIRACRAGFDHPVLGQLDPPAWLRFLVVHHRHHERVIGRIRDRA